MVEQLLAGVGIPDRWKIANSRAGASVEKQRAPGDRGALGTCFDDCGDQALRRRRIRPAPPIPTRPRASRPMVAGSGTDTASQRVAAPELAP